MFVNASSELSVVSHILKVQVLMNIALQAQNRGWVYTIAWPNCKYPMLLDIRSVDPSFFGYLGNSRGENVHAAVRITARTNPSYRLAKCVIHSSFFYKDSEIR